MSRRVTMSTLLRGNLKNWRKQNIRLLLGIFFAVFFLSLVMAGESCLMASAEAYRYDHYGEGDFYLIHTADTDTDSLLTEGVVSRYVLQENLLLVTNRPEDHDDDFSIARYSPELCAMLHYNLLAGRYPEKAGEIALERLTLSGIDNAARPGDTLKLNVTGWDGAAMLSPSQTKDYTLVGILEDRGSPLSKITGSKSAGIADFCQGLTAEEEVPLPGSRVMVQYWGVLQGNQTGLDAWLARHPRQGWNGFNCLSVSSMLSVLSGDTLVLAIALPIVGLALALTDLLALAAIMSAGLEARRRQIGLLRAIGATANQIRSLLLGEIGVISLCVFLPGFFAALGLLWGLSLLFPGWIVFRVDLPVLGLTFLLCLISLWLSALTPLSHALRITPMQAIRNTDAARQWSRKSLKSRKVYHLPRLLALRKAGFQRGRTVLLCLLLVAGTVLLTLSGFIVIQNAKYFSPLGSGSAPDYILYNNRSQDMDFLLSEYSSGRLTLEDEAVLSSLPLVSRVEGFQTTSVNVELSELTGYLTEVGLTYGQYYNSGDSSDIYIYQLIRQEYGYAGEIVQLELIAISPEKLRVTISALSEGTIDMDALNRGEAVLAVAPAAYMLETEERADSKFCRILTNPAQFRNSTGTLYRKDALSVGDTLQISRLVTDSALEFDSTAGSYILPDDVVKQSHDCTICGVIEPYKLPSNISFFGFSTICLLTTFDGLAAMGYGDTGYSEFSLYLTQEPDETTADLISDTLKRLASRSPHMNVYDGIEIAASNRRVSVVILSVCCCVLLLLFGFTYALLYSTLSNSIQADIPQLGTLRAVGASSFCITSVYNHQLLLPFLLGGGGGWLLGVGGVLLILLRLSQPLSGTVMQLSLLAPALLLILFGLCHISIRTKLRPVLKAPIVENIRSL